MRNWISVDDRVPECDIPVHMGCGEGPVVEFKRSKSFIVAEQKGEGFEEDKGEFTEDGVWMTDCDHVTHWCEDEIEDGFLEPLG